MPIIDTTYAHLRHTGLVGTCADIPTLGGGTGGVLFMLMGPCTIPGVRFYTPSAHTIRCSLWRETFDYGTTSFLTPTLERTVDVVCAGAGEYSASWATAYSVTEDRLCFDRYYVGMYVVGEDILIGSDNQMFVGNVLFNAMQLTYLIRHAREDYYYDGDVCPTLASIYKHPISPVVIVPDSLYLPTPFNSCAGGYRPDITTRSGGSYNNMTVGHKMVFWQPAMFYGWKFYTAGVGAHTVKLRFGITEGISPGTTLAETTVSCSGPGEHTELLGSPVQVTETLTRYAHSDRAYFFISMYTLGWITIVPAVPAAWLIPHSNAVNNNAGWFSNELARPDFSFWEPGDAILTPFAGNLSELLPIDPIVERISP